MTSTDVAVVFSLLENKEKEDSLLGEKRFIDERVTELENSIKVRMPFTAFQFCYSNLFCMYMFICVLWSIFLNEMLCYLPFRISQSKKPLLKLS